MTGLERSSISNIYIEEKTIKYKDMNKVEYSGKDGKRCLRCQVVKSMDEFILSEGKTTDGVSIYCHLCDIKISQLNNNINLNL